MRAGSRGRLGCNKTMPIAKRKPAPTPVQDSFPIPPKVPQLPDDVLARFPSLSGWQEDENSWWSRTQAALQNNNRAVSQTVTKNAQDTRNLTVSFNNFKVVIEEEIDVIVNEQEAIGRRIVSVSAQVGVNQNIKIQTTAPVGPAVNDYWINNSDLTTPITYQWDGGAWVEVTDPVAVAGVADEREARVTADGFLSGKYTLTVIAGNVVTGMNITSSTGAGTDVSSVIFRATDFQIYNGVVGKTMFSVSGADVNLAGVLTVSTSGKIFTGTGTYANANTYFYVDSSNRFSLGANLTWDGATLTITGSISATTGTIGGWTVAATTLTGGNATLDSTGQLILGTSNDVVYVSASDATYRLWIGNATAGSATFRVTKGGVMTATAGVFSGAITSTSGTIGGWTLSSTTLTGGNATLDSAGQLILGTSNDIVYLSATNATYRLWVGNVTAGSAAFSVTKTGLLSATGATISGAITATSGSFTGTITSTSGTIGGWTIGATTLTGGNATLDSAGQLILGTSNDVVYLSAFDATYRIWIGNVTAGSAAFSVTKAGVLSAIGGIFSGAITSTSGAIAGFTLASSTMSAGSGSDAIKIYSVPSAGAFIEFGTLASTAAVSVGNFGIVGYNAALHVTFSVSASGISTDGTCVVGGGFQGSGASITSLNASNISSGTLANARLPSTISVSSLEANNYSANGNGVTYGGLGGANNIGFTWNGSNVKVWVDGTLQGTIPNP